jgi:hypothetical protein
LRQAGAKKFEHQVLGFVNHRSTTQVLRQRRQISASARRQSCRSKQRLRDCSTRQIEALIGEQALSAPYTTHVAMATRMLSLTHTGAPTTLRSNRSSRRPITSSRAIAFE